MLFPASLESAATGIVCFFVVVGFSKSTGVELMERSTHNLGERVLNSVVDGRHHVGSRRKIGEEESSQSAQDEHAYIRTWQVAESDLRSGLHVKDSVQPEHFDASNIFQLC